MMIMALALIISLFFGFYWFRDNIYVEDFRELDKEPQYMKWVLFLYSLKTIQKSSSKPACR